MAVMLQSSANVHRGNSGGMILNAHGQLLGIVTSNAKQRITVGDGDGDGDGDGFAAAIIPTLNFSIPIQRLQPLLDYAVSEG